MAKKKEPSIQDGLKIFKDITTRASLTEFTIENGVLLAKDKKDHSIVITPDSELLTVIVDDEDLKKVIKPLDITNSTDYQLQPLFQIGRDPEVSKWFHLDPQVLYAGKVFKINIHGLEYEIPVNRDCLPLKLRKAEYCDLSFKVFTKPSNILAIRKYFAYPVESAGFAMFRLFQVI